MSSSIQVELEETALQALARLEADGLTRSQAVGQALVELASLHRRERLRADAQAAADDPADRQEMAQVLQEMQELTGPP